MLTIIMRGAPGFGKTTYAKKILPLLLGVDPDEIMICSADDFHINNQGEYDFHWANLGPAHKYCRELVYKTLTFQDGKIKVVVVDNTNINQIDMAYYWGLGSLFGKVEFHQLKADHNVAANRNVHGVPEKKAKEMANRLEFQPVPKVWQPEVIHVTSEDGAFTVKGVRYEIPALEVEEVADDSRPSDQDHVQV